MKRAAGVWLISFLIVSAFALPAHAEPGPFGEVAVVTGGCEDGTTIVRATNITDIDLSWLIRIDGRTVETGRLAPGESLERTYVVETGESHFYRIRLGLPPDGYYRSAEGLTDLTDCGSESPSPSPSPSPTQSVSPSPSPSSSSSSTPPVVSGGGGSTSPPDVLGNAGTSPGGSPTLPFTGPDDALILIAIALGFVLVGALALRLTSRPASVRSRD